MQELANMRSGARVAGQGAKWSLGIVLLGVLVVAAIPRLFALASFPLVITNDGEEYLRWAAMIADGRLGDIRFRPDRTPGYSLFLAGAIELFGKNAGAVLVAQHILGCIAALAVAACAYALSGPWAALIAGVLAAIDPWMFALESFALSEALAATLACLSAALVLNARPGHLLPVIGLAVLVGAMLLVRPAFQVFVPFCMAAWLCKPAAKDSVARRLSVRLGFVALFAAILLTMLAPWLRVHHAQHGDWRLAGGAGAHLWAGLARTNSLMQDYPLEPEIAEAFAPYRGRALSESDFWTFFKRIDGLGRREALLRHWALASVRDNPGRYVREAIRATLCQLNRGNDELGWILSRVCAPGTGVNFEGPPIHVQPFIRTAVDGPISRFMSAWAKAQNPGIPQFPLAIAASALIVVAAVRRQWRVALLLIATLVFVLFHAALLMPNGRYAMPMWMIWYAALAGLPGFVMAQRRGSSAGAGSRVSPSNPRL